MTSLQAIGLAFGLFLTGAAAKGSAPSCGFSVISIVAESDTNGPFQFQSDGTGSYVPYT
jgi:hypothetical protein